jgi:hypothetical protein
LVLARTGSAVEVVSGLERILGELHDVVGPEQYGTNGDDADGHGHPRLLLLSTGEGG